MNRDPTSNEGRSELAARAGVSPRFERRWRLVGAGLSNVWRFGDLELPAASGRLLLRGPNGTGKTTALEALAPYLLDLNPTRMSAGKARTTNLSSLMREGATGKRRYGYLWLTLAERREGTWSFGVRVQYSDGASPPVRVTPFAVPGRPLHELKLYGAARAPLTSEQFAEAVAACGGEIFETEETYVSHLAARLFGTPDRMEVVALAARLRQVRNPTLLGDVSPQAAAQALRESLPGVVDDVIGATAEALAESDTTRDAFTRDKEAAEILEDFRAVWCAHATQVVASSHAAAVDAARELKQQAARVKACVSDLAAISAAATTAKQHAEDLAAEIVRTRGEIDALEKHQSYQDAGRLGDLKQSALAHGQAAESAAQVMQTTARSVATECDSLRRGLENIREDLQEHQSHAKEADATVDNGTPLLRWTLRARAPLRAGQVIADPGSELVIHGDSATLREVASSWRQSAQRLAQQSNAATLAIANHRPVELHRNEATAKTKAAHDAAVAADAESANAKRAEGEAQDAARLLLGAMRVWTQGHPRLSEPLVPAPDGGAAQGPRGFAWTLEDVALLMNAEPSQVLTTADIWARHATARAEALAAELRARAVQAVAQAASLREQARVLRNEAEELRTGRLLPLPRPDWAGAGDDSLALGAALDWQPSFDDPNERALLEAAMAAAGLLGASLSDDGASTRSWRVEPAGAVCASNLSEFVTVDATHPLACAASAVLARVAVVPSAALIETEVSSVLRIGRDGTFCAGVLLGRAPGADDSAALVSASHIGARQRRAAALARAQSLDDQATLIEAHALVQEKIATQLHQDADAISAQVETIPSREELRAAEARRAQISRIAHSAQSLAATARTESEQAAEQFQRALTEWQESTRRCGLPVDLDLLIALRDRSARAAATLENAAGPLAGKLAERLDRLTANYSTEATAERLSMVESRAQEAFRIATETQTQVRVLEETAGAAIAEILARHEGAKKMFSTRQQELGPAQQGHLDAAKAQATAQEKLETAEKKLHEEAEPTATRQLLALRALVGVPGVADAVLDGEIPPQDNEILDQISAKIHGRRLLTMKTVLDRADTAKAKLAGVWSLDPGDNHGELLTFVLTYRDGTYTPIEAAAYAEKLKMRAEQALAASEERALREFVVGRLPSAIGTAWTRLQDWIIEVNQKMRSAAASSGVAVQVRIPLREDLAPASRDVYELSCKTSGAERTPEQQRRLGTALQALLAASQAETMQERVSSAVDIRDWVEVHYEVTRPGGSKQRWSSKTGLSGGERRLVVLAPMLAAIAAGYDRFGSNVLRLVTLDEVPAEVDERGREGLARYIAQLDLDLICTSYLWDGCPGAWDGIDAHDLEAGSDGTVVAFPMLVRGLLPIPELSSNESVAPAAEASE